MRIEKLVRFTTFSFHVLWSKLNSYPSFCTFYQWKLMSGHSSSSAFDHFQEFIISNYQKFRNSEFQKLKNGHRRFPEYRNFQNFQFSEFHRSDLSRMFPDFSWFFQVILINKMKKYGLHGPTTSIIHEMLSFRCLMPWNRDFISLPWRRQIQF